MSSFSSFRTVPLTQSEIQMSQPRKPSLERICIIEELLGALLVGGNHENIELVR